MLLRHLIITSFFKNKCYRVFFYYVTSCIITSLRVRAPYVETGGREKRLKPTGEKIFRDKSTRRPRGVTRQNLARGNDGK